MNTVSAATVDGLKLHIDEGIALVTLSRPERSNALTLALWRALPELFCRLERDPAVRGIVLTGAGKHFSAGADISEFGTVRVTREQAETYEREVDACCDAIFEVSKPTVAAVNGACRGGACNIAMSCDFRFAVPAASFGIPAARLSIVYGVKGTQRLLALVGLANAKRIFYTAEACTAARAREIGLVDEIVDDAVVGAREFLRGIARNAPLTIAGAKRVLNALGSGQGTLEAAAANEVIERAATSEDYRESVRAFAEKRPPVFKGS